MSDEKKYYDSDDNECTLDMMCRREPEWAASRHRVMLARIAELEAELEARAVRPHPRTGIVFCPRCTGDGDDELSEECPRCQGTGCENELLAAAESEITRMRAALTELERELELMELRAESAEGIATAAGSPIGGTVEEHCPRMCEETQLELAENTATVRGFRILRFPDVNGETCSLQESSIATEACIWFGVDDANPQMFVPGGNPAWRPMPLPELPDGGALLFSTRMHLSRKQVEQLLPHLQRFAETGELPIPCGGCGEVTCQWCQHEIDKAMGIDR